MPTDLYALLEVSPDAGDDEIRRAFRRLARRYHPDLNRDRSAPERFRLIAEAYQTLVDPVARYGYDREHLERRIRPYDAAAAEPGRANLFQEAGRRWQADGRDVLAVVEVDLEHSLAGGPTKVVAEGPVRCRECGGDGYDPAGHTVTCWTCHGTGTVTYTNRFGDSVGICLTCGGQKTQPAGPCRVCAGAGTIDTRRTVLFDLPAGADDGDTITVAGQGGPGGGGGRAGDLLVVVRVRPHLVFTRSGADLSAKVSVTYPQAVFGAEVEVPTIAGSTRMEIPAGTQGGTVFRLAGRGVRHGATAGDLLVTVTVAVPVDPGGEHRRLLERLRQFDP